MEQGDKLEVRAVLQLAMAAPWVQTAIVAGWDNFLAGADEVNEFGRVDFSAAGVFHDVVRCDVLTEALCRRDFRLPVDISEEDAGAMDNLHVFSVRGLVLLEAHSRIAHCAAILDRRLLPAAFSAE